MSASASKSALLLSPCLRWAAPGMREYEDEFADTTKRDKGTVFHLIMERYYSKEPSEAPKWPEVTDWAHKAVAWSLEHLEPRCDYIYPEVYVATNFGTGEVHSDPNVKNRAYPDRPGFLPGTADLVCVLRDGSLLVADWKTGGGTGADKQLLTLALGCRDVFRTPSGALRPVLLAVLYAGEDGVRPHEWAVTSDELEAHRTAMHFQLADVGRRTEPVPGIHCTQLYCPHLAYCPGISATVESAAESPEGLLPKERLVRRYDISTAPTGPQHAGAIMERVSAAKRQMAFYEQRVRSYIDDGGRCLAGEFEFSKGKDGFRWRTVK